MARPTKCRRVEFFPENTFFIPRGKPKCNLDEIVLKVEELEAMRLKDIEDLTQEECSKRMHVSRSTFQNILESARKKVTKALIKGNALRIDGGYYTTKYCNFKCLGCKKTYQVKFERDKYKCPECGSKEVICSKKASFCGKWCEQTN